MRKEILTSAPASADDWRTTLAKVIPAVVALRVVTCKAFDTECEGSGSSTGFIVDKKRGIILTNRHVVQPGPVVAEAMFNNMEEIPVFPLYRDPVHDFGFFRYDPGAVQFLSYEEIPLAPEVSSVGLEIRVVGNDRGEQVSILAGTIARLDRNSPVYTNDGYNDFNTFYMQAASGTKGGSSGSPVVDWQGRAVAMNAGGSLDESLRAYFLPLERVVRALNFIQKSKDLSGCGWEALTIPRGTLQATFLRKGFNETRKLGLKSETEQMVRHVSPAGETGMLVVDSLVPDGPAHKQLQPGDILVRVNGEVITRFLNFETVLDDSVGQRVDLFIQRGDISLTVNILVQDLHSITPNSFLEVSDAVIHALSYQQARNFHFKCGVVYVAKPGYMLSRASVPRHAIIKKFAGKEILQLDDLIAVLSELTRGAQVALEYISHSDRFHSKSVLVTVDCHEWYGPPQIYTRNDSTGLWTARPALPHESKLLSSNHCYRNDPPSETNLLTTREVGTLDLRSEEANKYRRDGFCRSVATDQHVGRQIHSLGEPNAGTKNQHLEDDASIKDIVLTDHTICEPAEERLTDIRYLNNTGKLGDQGGITANASVVERVLEPTLVLCEVHVPPSCQVDGVYSQEFLGTGVIVYHSQNMGLVVVDKYTVVVSCCDVMLSFAASHMKIPGEVVFLHPVHNYAFVAYDPSSLGVTGASAVRSAKVLSEPALLRGDSVFLVGLTKSLQAKSRKSNVVDPCAALQDSEYKDWPAYMATNMEVIELDSSFGGSFSAVLADERGFVQAIWGRFSQMKFGVGGIPIYAVSEVLANILHGERGKLRFINGIPRPMPLLRILDAALHGILPSEARSFGLSDCWIQALVKKDPVRRQVLRVKGCLAGSEAAKKLETNDMILAINKELVTCFRDVEKACQGLDVSEEGHDTLSMTIFRKGQVKEVIVGTDVRDGNGTTRIVSWCGCIVQEPHPAVRALGFLPEEGRCVYVSRSSGGSPARTYGLEARKWIVEVNEKLTPDLDSFVEVIKGLEHGEFVRVRAVLLNGTSKVYSLKQDLHYWPAWELKFDMETAVWRRGMIKALNV
ncbi:hypothetical protein MKW98_031288 [Papaver atlanticum]|uniref:Pro-apoptotic serine protease NMA111 n=1 Tax=Papaver atlanticum TaxID=357466 RepID=A0AAD4S5E0_9MAGN|nr:hypothetical protein MKW98_031288 [Papaver atlanticum]